MLLPGQSDRLRLVPLSIKAADRFVGEHHRHHQPTHGKAKFALGAARGEQLVGVIPSWADRVVGSMTGQEAA